jgi:hypothetical protein
MTRTARCCPSRGSRVSFRPTSATSTTRPGTPPSHRSSATTRLRSANVLYKEGADGIQKYIDQTNDSGYAAKVAADRTDNLAGDIERLGGSIDTALIQTGSGANDVLRGIVQSVGFLVDSFGSLPCPGPRLGSRGGRGRGGDRLAGGAALIGFPSSTP